MISEADAWWAVPPAGWVHDYMQHAVKQTTAPAGYHLATALSLLAVTTPTSYSHRYAGDLYANVYTLLVGRSGEDQKSTALGIGREILQVVDPSLLGRQPGSWEGLIDSLADQPRQIIRYSEFGAFLAKAQKKGGYFEPLKALLTDLWDCTPQSRAKANGAGTSVPHPRLSIFAACSLPYLEEHTDPHDWSGGFMGRWAVIFARRERTDPDPVGDPTAIPALADALRLRAQQAQVAPCLGLDPAAQALWRDWYFDLERRPVPEIIAGAKTRAPTIARKAAMLYAWDFGEPLQGAPWKIGVHHLSWGIRFAELHLASVTGIAGILAEHPEARLRRQVLDAVPAGSARTLGQLLAITKRKKKSLLEVLDGLVLDGSLRLHAVSGVVGDALYERPRPPDDDPGAFGYPPSGPPSPTAAPTAPARAHGLGLDFDGADFDGAGLD